VDNCLARFHRPSSTITGTCAHDGEADGSDKIALTEEGSVAGAPFVPPKWRKPAPLGCGNAIDSVGTVGSSLLAGFSLASVIVVTSAAGQFRWPGAVPALAGRS
jgi:hypothetical protein